MTLRNWMRELRSLRSTRGDALEQDVGNESGPIDGRSLLAWIDSASSSLAWCCVDEQKWITGVHATIAEDRQHEVD